MKSKAAMFWMAILFVFTGAMTILYAAGLIGRESSAVGHARDESLVQGDPLAGEWVDFVLTDQTGTEFRSESMKGQVWLASYFFASCPSVCVQQNQQLAKLQDEYGSEGLQSVCITCDPAHDTPEALAAYASRFGAKPETWHFLTGDVKQIKDVGSRMFRVSVDEQMHSDRLMLVGRDGKVVGTYRSSEPEQLAALRVELKKQLDDDSGHVAQGSSAVNGDGADPTQLPVAFFTLTDQLGQDFDTKKLEGQYWLASFFFTRCPSICRALNQEVAKVQAAYADRGLQIVSITCDPAHDTPSVLLNYGKLFNARPESWHFLTGAFPEIKQIANEHFGKMLEEEVHSDRLFVIGPDGHIVESFRSTQADQVQALHAKLAELLTPAGQ